MATNLKSILDDTASAIAADSGLAAARLNACRELVGVTEVDVRLGNQAHLEQAAASGDAPPGSGGQLPPHSARRRRRYGTR